MLELQATQKCRTCGEVKPLGQFDIRADTGKRNTQCKECRRQYQNERLRRITPESTRSSRMIGSADLFRCTKCGEMKPADAFPRRTAGGLILQSWCRDCFRQFNAASHQRNHELNMERIRRNQAQRIASNKARAREYLMGHPCVDCGETDLCVLDFDHVRGKKIADVSVMVSTGWAWEKIAAEIEKCEVRCANDHRRVTLARRLAKAS